MKAPYTSCKNSCLAETLPDSQCRVLKQGRYEAIWKIRIQTPMVQGRSTMKAPYTSCKNSCFAGNSERRVQGAGCRVEG